MCGRSDGFIFISLAENPPDFSKVMEDYHPFLTTYKIDKARVAFRKRYELRTNWKLIAENFRNVTTAARLTLNTAAPSLAPIYGSQ
jgi:Rieske 2Fe-2S family protein